MNAPYRSTPVFDETTLPAALRAEHDTKPGVWAVICVLEGALRFTILDPRSERVLTPANPGLVTPRQKHFVTPLGAMRCRVDFYDGPPGLSENSDAQGTENTDG